MMSSIDTRIIKASFRGNPPEERRMFSQSCCLMPISVGQSIHEGKKFEAVIKLINNSFKQCTILVDDSVQRHTLAILKNLDAEHLHNFANEEGDQWLARNKSYFAQLTIPYDIMRWDYWLQHMKFPQSLQRVKDKYAQNATYKAAIHANIDEFLSRYLKDIDSTNFDDQRANKLCLDYLLEECAVMCLWPENKYDFEVYPSGRNQAMAATYEQLIHPVTPSYLRPVALRFKKYSGIEQKSVYGVEVETTVSDN